MTSTNVLSFMGSKFTEALMNLNNLLEKQFSRHHIEYSVYTDTFPDINVFELDICTCMSLPPISLLSKCPSTIKNTFETSINNHKNLPLIQIFGLSEEGVSILVNVWGMFPYVYVKCPSRLISALEIIEDTLEFCLREALGKKDFEKCILKIDIVYSKSLLYYEGDFVDPFLRIYLINPQYVSSLKGKIEKGVNIKLNNGEVVPLPTQLFEANIPFELRFMIDVHMKGCSWFKVLSDNYILRDNQLTTKTSYCQIEIDTFCEYISILPLENIRRNIPPLRILSFDIECITATGKGFPVPETDPVIQIASVMKEYGNENILFKVVYMLNSCNTLPNVIICCFDHEQDMLIQWKNLIRYFDPDIITGYNCINFDLYYLMVRASVLKIESFKELSRLIGNQCRVRDVTLSSKGLGTHENKLINMEGRIQMDMLDIIRRDHKLKSYTLNAVSAFFLKEQKEDVHYTMLRELFQTNADTRRRIASYCLKDAILPERLMSKLLILVTYIEMARVTGTPIKYLLTRGQQIKVTSQILRKCLEMGYLFPTINMKNSSNDPPFEGATVLNPLKGLYKNPTVVLDFASLYPSVIIAHNLCYSTLCLKSLDTLKLSKNDVTQTPTKNYFVNAKKRQGLLPLVVQDLITARKKTKEEMNQTTDETTKMVLNCRQLAMKVSANSVYGYTGVVAGGHLPCLEMSTSITAYGRDMIEFTKKTVEEVFTAENGYPFSAKVVYGDTDSVMILFNTDNVEMATKYGKQVAEYVTQKFCRPIKLEFEKIFYPLLLMNKKRYAGLLYNASNDEPYIECKGIETVRRDFCPLVQKVVDTVLRKLLIEKDEEGAKQYTQNVISQLLLHEIDLSLLVLSKSIGKEEYNSKLAHVELAKKMRIRDPGNAPQVGDRIHFVILPGTKGKPQYERAEDPLYVLENNLTIDTQYYLDHIKKPLIRIFEAIMPDPESLFLGDHTKKKKLLISSSGALSKFVTTNLRCLQCRTVITEGSFCSFCGKSDQRKLVISKINKFREKELEYNKLWTQCQGCQGSINQDVLCTSRDCPIFYRRMKIKKDLEESRSQIERLHTDW